MGLGRFGGGSGGLTSGQLKILTDAAQSRIVFDASGDYGGNVVTSYAELAAALGAITAPAEVLLASDLSIPSGQRLDCRGLVAFVGVPNMGTAPTITIPDGAGIDDPAAFIGVDVVTTPIGSPSMVFSIPDGQLMLLDGSTLSRTVTSTTHTISVTDDDFLLSVRDGSGLVNQAAATRMVNIGPGLFMDISVSDNLFGEDSPIPASAIGGAVGTSVYIQEDASSQTPAQTHMSGSVFRTRVDKAANMDPSRGDSASRPTLPVQGQMYFDTDLAEPIWWDGGAWLPAGSIGGPGDLPAGGTAGQLLRKNSSVDYDASFATATKSDVGLGNVDNTSDLNKPVSTAVQTALDLKLDDSQVSAFGLTLIDDASAAAARTTLELGALATASSLTKADVGLGNVDNTSDANKPISTATQTALNLKVDDSQISAFGLTLVDDVDATAARTTLGLGNVNNTSDLSKPISTATQAALDAKVDDSQVSAFGLTLVDDVDATAARTTLGLGSVDNTSDLAKPISTATQTALDAKVDDSQISAFGLTLIDDASAAAARTTLGLGTLATASSVTSANVTDFTEAAQDAALAVVSGTNGIAYTYNDAGNTATISPTYGTTANTVCQGNDARLATFTSGASGIVPASGGGTTNFLRADGTWAAAGGGGGGSPGGSTTKVQFNNAGAFDGAANVEIESGNLRLEVNAPATPAAGGLVLSARELGMMRAGYVCNSGFQAEFQADIARTRAGHWAPAAGATTVTVLGLPAITAVGTATARAIATTNAFTRTKRVAYVSAATAGALSSSRFAAAQCTVGNGTGLGGFLYQREFGIGDAATVAGARMFIWIRALLTAATNVEPNTLVNCIGVGHGAADTNLRIFYGGTTAQTSIDLGANFPADTRSTDMYRLTLFAPATYTGNPKVNYFVERLGTAFTASGTLDGAAAVLPTATVLLTENIYRTNNATALAVSLDLGHMSIGST